MTKVGPKEAQRRKLREREGLRGLAAMSRDQIEHAIMGFTVKGADRQRGRILAGKTPDRGFSSTIPKPPRRATQKPVMDAPAIKAAWAATMDRRAKQWKGPSPRYVTKPGFHRIDGDGTLKPASEPKRMGRRPKLFKTDYDALDAAPRDLLAVALRYYNKHAARNLKQKA